MGACFVPNCSHTAQRETCRFYRFPSEKKEMERRQKWIRLINREDRLPTEHSRVCSCHFVDGNKKNLPEIFERKRAKVFPQFFTKRLKMQDGKSVSQSTPAKEPISKEEASNAPPRSPQNHDILQEVKSEPQSSPPYEPNINEETSSIPSPYNSPDEDHDLQVKFQTQSIPPVNESDINEETLSVPSHSPQNQDLQRSEMMSENCFLDSAEEAMRLRNELVYARNTHYSVKKLSAKVIRMETGLPTGAIFNFLVQYVQQFEDTIVYSYGWKVDHEQISLEDQVFITLMKIRQNYPILHIATLFGCSSTIIRNIISTFVTVLHKLLAQNIVGRKCPSRIDAPSAFINFPTSKMVIDCTDFRVDIQKKMDDKQKSMPWAPRATNSFKSLLGVSPNGVITYMSKLYEDSMSNKYIFKNCGIVSLLTPEDIILADKTKGFITDDVAPPRSSSANVPPGATSNISSSLPKPPTTESLNQPPATDSDVRVKASEDIASCRVHVERANASLRAFKMLSVIPQRFCDQADVIVQLVAALVNLQFPLVTERANNFE